MRTGWGVLMLVLACGACAEPFSPRAGVATQDDPGSDGFVSVSVGRAHTCAIAGDSTAFCWGSNEQGQLGIVPDTITCRTGNRVVACATAPTRVASSTRFRRISAGGDHTCALSVDLRLHCWGDNEFGQVGDPAVRRAAQPVPVVTTSLFIDVAAGGAHTCAVRTDGVVACWGANSAGQLGLGSQAAGATVPLAVAGSQRFVAIAAGERRTCARAATGSPYCWGETWVTRNDQGIEVMRVVTSPEPVVATAAPDLHAISVGASTCGIGPMNRVHCWESNVSGSLGDGSLVGGTSPREVAGGLEYVAIASGSRHTCAIAVSGAVHCWGSDALGQLGVPPSNLDRRCGEGGPCALEPVPVSGWRQYVGLSAGLGDHVCGVTVRGNVYCWGAGSLGQRGDGRRTAGEWSPARTRPPAAL